MQVPDNYTKFLPLMEKDPGHWGGAYADGDTLVIKVVNQSLDDAQVVLQDVGVSEGVKLLSAGQSMDSLDATQGLVEKLLKTGSMEHVSSWGPDYRKSSIRVTTSEIIPGLQKSLDAARLPTGPAVDVEVSPGVPQTASRYYDTIPYYGGNAITLFDDPSGSFRYCSTAFQMVGSDGYSYAATAGHCYRESPGGDYTGVWRWGTNNSRYRIGTIWTTSVTLTGNASGRKGDLAFYRLNPVSGYQDNALGYEKVFIGNGDSTSTRVVAGSTVLPQDYHTSYLRTSGASGKYFNNSSYGEISPDWVSLVNQSIYYSNSGATYSGLTVAEDVSECVRSGDSGGAYYMQSGASGATAVGVISGTNNSGGGAYNCRNYYSPMNTFYVTYTLR